MSGEIKAVFKRSLPLRPWRNLGVLCAKSFLPFVMAVTAHAQDTSPFTDTRDGGKLHVASGFVCPAKIGAFERDAVGIADAGDHGDFCAYSALNGVYGTIRLVPLNGPYDARTSFAEDFTVEEGLGGKMIADGMATLPLKPAPLALYARTYETMKLEDFRTRVLFAGTGFGKWAVETTIEYADPRDTANESQFLHAVYAAAEREIGAK